MTPDEFEGVRARIWRTGGKAKHFCPTDTLDAMMPEIETIIREATEAEREACARIAEEMDSHPDRPHRFEIATAIRHRGRSAPPDDTA
ncbi:MAG: hypothetical protein JXQ75_08355 [Phycisphaerae bacterium]|nr:hypothetical protein [Phycisphaerae bacterium]